MLSPGDETFEKFAFHAAHGVDEIVVADPELRTVRWWQRTANGNPPSASSSVLSVLCDDVVAGIDWP